MKDAATATAFEAIATIGTIRDELEVQLSTDLVDLLSQQIYKTTSKAIEELVVNSYDAKATICRIFVPELYNKPIVIFDDGTGMDETGLKDLWHIGRTKERSKEIEKRLGRKQIGKFGIGKLAANFIANRLTYVTCTKAGILSVGIDFRRFKKKKGNDPTRIILPIMSFPETGQLGSAEFYIESCKNVGIDPAVILSVDHERPWTMAIIEDFKEPFKATTRLGNLRWVLRTAMPLESKFRIFLNKKEIESAKLTFPKIVEFDLCELPDETLLRLNKETGEEWIKVDSSIVSSEHFKDGIRGSIFITDRSLEGKSADLGRSHGFFIYIRRRLINADDPSFGMSLSNLDLLHRFYARIDVDGLDDSILASREELDPTGKEVKSFRALLVEVYNEARSRRNRLIAESATKRSHKKEAERELIDPFLIEQPIADALSTEIKRRRDPSIDTTREKSTLFETIEIDRDSLDETINKLNLKSLRPYKYEYTNLGNDRGVGIFNPERASFIINADHEFIAAYADNPNAQIILEDFVTAEVMLRIHLINSGLDDSTVTDVLARRDSLLRNLARSHPKSPKAMARILKDAAKNERDLEFSLVAAARAIGFDSKHIGGSGEPDGIAVLKYYPRDSIKITLEAKASTGTPQLNTIDFSGLAEHMKKHDAQGCLLVAPSYPGAKRKDESAVSVRAVQERVSCWTVDQVVRFLKSAEELRLTAMAFAQIVTNSFSPNQVGSALEDLLSGYDWTEQELQEAVVKALISLNDRLTNSPRSIEMIATQIATQDKFSGIEIPGVRQTLERMVDRSHGGIALSGDRIEMNISLDELARRISPHATNALWSDSFRTFGKRHWAAEPPA